MKLKTLHFAVVVLVLNINNVLGQDFIGKVKKSENQVTFVVDENLQMLDLQHSMYNYRQSASQVSQYIASSFNIIKSSEGFVASSFTNDSLINTGADVLYKTILDCFAEHRPLVLSPDMIWLVIAQGFSHYVNDNAETLRPKFVTHDGKVDLVVETKEDLIQGNPDWTSIMAGFEKQIAEKTKGDIAKTITADFTTTGPAERVASQITLMDVVKNYFEFIVHRLACGIPYITLTGTPTDWQKVLDKTMALEQYGLEWWTKRLQPILAEFVKASNGQPNQKFWQNMVMKVTPGRLQGGACDFRDPTELDGWFLHLFPYDKNGMRVPETIPHTTNMLNEMVQVPFRYIITDEQGIKVSEIAMELYSGFIGVKENSQTHALTPQIGWMVRIAEDQSSLINRFDQLANVTTDAEGYESLLTGLELRVKEVPDALKQLKSINRITLYFTDHIVIPEWMDEKHIEHFSIKSGTITEMEADELMRRFPKLHLDVTPGNRVANSKKKHLPLLVVNGYILKGNSAEALAERFSEVEENASETTIASLIEEMLGYKVDDIEEIRVLKDSAATAVWGARGANGVLEIDLKPTVKSVPAKKAKK